MDKCIYLKNQSQNANYNSQEHIIPAGLGGIKKLPRGYVSDEINRRFSEIEREGLRNSLITSNRLRNGPGKRGNQRLEKEKNIRIKILNDEEDMGTGLLLGFLFSGKSYIINQVKLKFDSNLNYGKCIYFGNNYESINHIDRINTFKRDLLNLLFSKNAKFEFVKSEFTIPENTIIIGQYREKYYICTNLPLFSYDFIGSFLMSETIEKLKSKKTINRNYDEITDKDFRFRQEIDLNSDVFAFMFIKTAFNAAAFLMEQDFVLNDIFDELRLDILNCSNLEKYIYPAQEVDSFIRPIIKESSDKSHSVYIIGTNKKIYSYVSLYNEWFAHLVLVNEYYGPEFSAGFICDWYNKFETYFRNDNFA